MANLYLNDTYLTEATLKVVSVTRTATDTIAFALADNIGRPGGGGQPADKCSFTHRDTTFEIERVYKQSEKPFQTIYEYAPFGHAAVEVGDVIDFHVDRTRRLELSRCHTLTHVVMAAIRRAVPDYESRGAETLDDQKTSRLWFAAVNPLCDKQVREIDLMARSVIHKDLPIKIVSEPSIDVAQFKYDAWRVDTTLGLKGKVRIVLIGDDWDANPCSGTHVRTTGEIVPFSIEGVVRDEQRDCWCMTVSETGFWSKWYGD